MTSDTAHEFGALGRADLLVWTQKHYDIIARFGRFAHRNAVLGREATPQEIEFLTTRIEFLVHHQAQSASSTPASSRYYACAAAN